MFRPKRPAKSRAVRAEQTRKLGFEALEKHGRFCKVFNKNILSILLITFLAVGLAYVCSVRSKRSNYYQNLQMEMNAVHNLNNGHEKYLLPDDIVSESNKPLLSWRVAHLIDSSTNVNELGDFQFSMNEPWNSPSNIPALKIKPPFVFFPAKGKKNKQGDTCLSRINEVHELLKNGYSFDDNSEAAYLIIVDAAFSVPWTKPQDVSLKDLIKGNVRLFTDAYPAYCDVHGRFRYLDKVPENEKEWLNLCGMD